MISLIHFLILKPFDRFEAVHRVFECDEASVGVRLRQNDYLLDSSDWWSEFEYKGDREAEVPEGDLWPRVQAHWLIGLGRRDIEDERERECPEGLV